MYLKFFKFIPVIFLFAVFLIPQEAFSQSDMEQIYKMYEQGNYVPSSDVEKEMLSEYLSSNQKSNNISLERLDSPDATFFFEENFSAPSLLFDNFDYTGLLSDNGWSAHSGAGSNQISTTTGLTYTGYEGSGIGNAAFIGAYSTSAEDVNKGFTEQNINGDVVYFSFLVNVTDTATNKTGTYFAHIGNRTSPTSFTSFAARVFAKIESGSVYFGLSNTSTATYGTTAFAKNTTYLLIVKYTINTAGNDEAKLWVVSSGVPADEVAAGTPEVTNTTTLGQDVIDAFALRQSGSTQAELVFDGIRIGVTWDEMFQAPSLPAGWTNVDNGTSGQVWQFNNPGARTITGNFDADFAILDSDNYGSGNSQDATLTTVAVNCAAATAVTLGFDQSFRSYSGSYGLLEVSNDGSTWIKLDSITVSTGYPNPPVYSEYDITSIAAGQSTVYARWTYVGSWGYWWAIDNVVIYEPDPIPNPAVVVSPADGGIDISANTTLNWIAGGGAAPTGYRINFGTDNPPTNIENNTNLGLVTTYTPTSALAYSTTYYWEIIPYNGAGDAIGTVVWSFTTMADPTVTTFPYVENFDGTVTGDPTPPAGWMQDPANTEDWEWDDIISYGPTADHTSGTGMAGYVDDSTPYSNPSNLLTPPFDVTGLTTPNAKFFYWIGRDTYPGLPSFLNLDISTDGGSTWNDSVITALVQNNQWDEVIIDLTSYSSSALVLRFSGYEDLTNFQCDVAIDDFSVYDATAPPSCAINVSPPDGEDSVSVFTSLNWTSGGGDPTGYLIYFGTDNPPTNIENGTDLGNVTTYVPSTTLSSATTYYWQIIAYNGNGNSTGCDIWSFTTYPDAPLSGTYTVGLTEFIQKTGKQVYFETRTRTVTKDINGVDAVEDINAVDGDTEITNPDLSPKYITVTETYKELMENGKPFDRNFYLESTDGVYPTLTEAVNDLNLRGVSGPVIFSLVDTYYPNETYPILIGEIGGASSTNTVTIKPATGIITEIPGDIAQPTSTLQLGYADYVIIDGSNTTGGTTKDLKIQGLNGDPAVHFYGDASNNVVKNISAESNNTSTGSGGIIFGSGPFASDNNVIQNCTVKNIDSSTTRLGVGVYFFSTNTGTGNQVVGSEVYGWNNYGIRLQGAPTTNTLVSGCDIYMTSSGTSPYGLYISRVDGLIIEKCKVREIIGTTTPRAMYLSGSSTSGSYVIRNNFMSLSGTTNLTSGTLYGLYVFGYAANDIEIYHNSISIGGTDVTTGSSYGFYKGNDANIFKAYNNAIHNARSNSTGTGTHYAVYVSDTTNIVSFELDYNDYYADGTGGTFGYYQGTGAIADLTTWQTTTGRDANSLSADPGFIGNDDLHIKTFVNNLDGQGLYFASVPDDIDGNPRNVTTPDIGADEYDYVPPSVVDPTNVTATAISETQIDVGFTPNGNNDNVVIVFNLDGVFTTPSGPPPAPGNPFAGGTLLANTITSPYSHTSLTNNTTYYYKLFSYDGANYSFGVTANATTLFGTITTFPWNDDLENPGYPGMPPGWTQDTGDDFDWSFDAGGTPSSLTGPSIDHNPGTSTGTYAFTESSTPNYPEKTAIIYTPEFDVSALTNPVFSFWYHMYGSTMGTMSVDYSTDGGTTWVNAWSETGNKGDEWNFGEICLPTTANLLRFHGLTGSSFYSDMAFDDVTIYDNINVPNPATNPSPVDLATDVFINTNFSWQTGGGGPCGYKVYLDTSTPPTTEVYDGPLTSFDPPVDLAYATTYYWQVVPYNSIGSAVGCPIWSFTTQADPTITTFPFVETFEEDSPTRASWQQIQEVGAGLWTFNVGAGGGLITTAYEDSLNARFVSQSGTNSPITKLVSPPLDLSSVLAPRVYFAYGQENWVGDQNQLKVYYRISNTDPWVEIAHYTDDVPAWTVTSLFLPDASSTYQLAFEGINNWGRANVLDSVTVQQGPANDVATVSVDMLTEYNPGSVTPLATVGNYGSATQTFDVEMTITGGYTSTKTVTALAPGATQQVTFDAWNATNGMFTVDVTTLLVGDADPSNDSKSLDVTVANGTWSSGNNLPETIYLGSGVAHNGFLYHIGGNTTSTLSTEGYKYEVATDTWTSIAPLPVGKVTHSVAAAGNFIYAIGGASPTTSQYNDTVYKYDITLNTWSQVASLPAVVGWVAAAGYNGTHIYVAGGRDNAAALRTVYVYDVVANTWSSATSMPWFRWAGGFAVTGNKLVYVSGIDDVDFNDSVYVGTIDAVDPTIITWVSSESIFPGAEELNARRYEQDITEMFVDDEINKELIPLLPEAVYPPGGVYKFEGETWGPDEIIVAGGNNFGGSSYWTAVDFCYTYNPTTDTWTSEFPLPIATLGAGCGSVNDGGVWKFVVAGGYDSPTIIDATQIYTVDFGGTTTFPLALSVLDGWNMVSVPGINPAGMGTTDWWPGLTGDVYNWGPGYGTVTTTTPTEGYWMKHTGAQVYNYPAIEIVPNDPIAAVAGWNLIGGYENSATVTNITTNPPGLVDGPVYGFNGGYTTPATMDPGYGYWIKLSGAGQIILPSSLAKGSGEIVEWFKEDWGRIVLTDATGKKFTLYAVTGEVNLNQYEMPPLPPQGMFDIRYNSNRIAEDINSSVQAVDMTGVEYPLTVKVEGMDMRIMDETGKKINENVKDGEEIVIGDAQINKLMVSGELLPTVYALQQNYPNPFNPSTTIEFSLPEEVKNVKLSIYNVLGEKVAELVNTSLIAGNYKFQWNGTNIASGMYIYELRTDKFVSVKKMMLLK